jgi:hypothetical protein
VLHGKLRLELFLFGLLGHDKTKLTFEIENTPNFVLDYRTKLEAVRKLCRSRATGGVTWALVITQVGLSQYATGDAHLRPI